MPPAAPSMVVTGMGAWCAGAGDVPSLWRNAVEGKVSLEVRSLARVPTSIAVYAAASPHFSPSDQRLVRGADRSASLALAAVREAWKQSAPPAELDRRRVGVFIGTSRGPVGLNDYNSHHPAKRPSAALYSTLSSIAGIVAGSIRAEGCALMLSATCASGAAALHQALQTLRSGALDIAVVGGVDAPLVDSLLEQMVLAGITSSRTTPDALRPFDRHRCGTVIGEGAAFLVLETAPFAQARGAVILGEVAAVALRCQSSQRAGLDPDGRLIQEVIRASLAEADLQSRDIDLLHLHGTATRMNDASEGRAMRAVFGTAKEQPHAWASKAITGHTLGASSLFQVVLTLEALRHGVIPRTVNCTEPDPDCSLRLNTASPISLPLRSGLCSTSGFWGNYSSIIIRRNSV